MHALTVLQGDLGDGRWCERNHTISHRHVSGDTYTRTIYIILHVQYILYYTYNIYYITRTIYIILHVQYILYYTYNIYYMCMYTIACHDNALTKYALFHKESCR